MQNKSCHFFFLCLRKLRRTQHYMTLCEQRLPFTTSAWCCYKALIWEYGSSSSEYFISLSWCPPRCPIKGAKDSICLCTWCIIRLRFIIASLSQCHRFARPPKFIISRWHWQETVFLHNILWSIAHMCVQSHDCYQHWQSVCHNTILEPIIAFKLLSRLRQFGKKIIVP